MKEWQKLLFNALFNLSVALIAGGLLRLLLDFKSIVSAVSVFFFGVYFLGLVTYYAIKIENQKNQRS